MNKSKNPAIYCLFVILLLLSLDGLAFADSIDQYEEIVAGDYYTVGRETNWTLWAWGNNTYGQLGDGTTVDKLAPVQIGTDDTWFFIDAGYGHTTGIKADGTLWAWGYNGYGQLGDGTIVDKLAPAQIGTDNTWVFIAAGSLHTIGIKEDGTLWAWGYNGYGQLGDGTIVDKLAPVQIGTDSDWFSVAAGDYHTIGLKMDGTLWAWGYNSHGQLGDGTTVDKLAPVQIGTDDDWDIAAAGYAHTAGIKVDGTLWAWGYNSHGRLGDGTTVDRLAPVQIGTDDIWFSVTAGYGHTAGTKTDGTLWAWGYNYQGRLGDGTTVDRLAPVQIGTDNDWFSVSAGFAHTAGIKTDKTIWTWGSNTFGQVGDGTTANQTTPTIVINLTPDVTPPTAGPVVASNTAYSNFVDSTFDLAATFTENESAITSCEYCVSTDGTCDTEWAPATVSGSSPAFTCTITGISGTNGQALSLNMQATSRGGTGTGVKITKTVDATAPTYTWNAPAAGAYYGNGNTINVDVSISETGSGVTNGSNCNPKIDNATGSFTGAVTYSSSGGKCTGTLTLNASSGLSDGSHDLTLQVTDNVGNSAASAARTVSIDNTPPVSGTAFNATPGDRQCSLNWTAATDSVGLHTTQPYELRVQAGSDPVSCLGGTQAYIGTGLSKTQTNLTNGTTYYYRLCYKDKTGNQSEFTGNPKTCVLPPSPPQQFALTVTKPKGGTVTASGIACGTGGTECTESIAAATPPTNVILTAAPDQGFGIGVWTGCTPSPDNTTCTVAMSSAKTVKVTFLTYKLTVTKPKGGTVTASGITCGTGGTECTESIAAATPPTNVILTAAPDQGFGIGVWTGCTPSGDNTTCTVSMSAAKTVKVTFLTFKLTVTKPKGGMVTASGITCGGTVGTDCTESIAAATPPANVTLTALPDPGFGIGVWTGCTPSGDNTTCTVAMSAAKKIKVTFLTYKLTVTKPKGGTVTASGITCGTVGTDCTESIAAATPPANVTLTAAPDQGFGIGVWTGCTPSIDNTTCTVAMSSARTVKVSFIH